MTKRREEEEPTLEEVTFKALLVAKEAFEKHLTDFGNDPGYWDLKLTAWTKTVESFERLQRFEIEDELK